MEHVVRKYAGNGWECGACAFATYAEDLSGVAHHVVLFQPTVREEVWFGSEED